MGPFLDAYIAGRTGAKRRTILNLRTCRDRLVTHFGEQRDLRKITQAEADGFRLWMLEQEYAAATVGRTIKRCRQFFAYAIDAELLSKNPFTKVKAAACENRARIRFVDRKEATAVLEACPDLQHRLVFALSRFGGLRCPSEIIELEWSDVNWELDRFWVRSPKTEHHEGKEGRWVPIFPELRPFLDEAFDAAESGAVKVVTIADFEGAGAPPAVRPHHPPGRTEAPGSGYSTTCGPAGKRSWRPTTPCTSSASGWATRRRLRPSIT